MVGYRHPETGEPTAVAIKSNDFSSSRKEAYSSTPFKVGDDVTAVYLPGRLAKTLRLYAFLELSPDVNLRLRPLARTPTSPLEDRRSGRGHPRPLPRLAREPLRVRTLPADRVRVPPGRRAGRDRRPAAGRRPVRGALLRPPRGAGPYSRKRALAALATGKAVEAGTPFLGTRPPGLGPARSRGGGIAATGRIDCGVLVLHGQRLARSIAFAARARHHRRHDHDARTRSCSANTIG